MVYYDTVSRGYRMVPLLLEVFNNHGFNGRNGIYET